MTEPSYVVMNSRQILDLTKKERECLDSARWVFCMNRFPEFWKVARFRPTVWMMGDTETTDDCDILINQIEALLRDRRELGSRMTQLYVCAESSWAIETRDHKDYEMVPITRYRRGHWSDDKQQFATSFFEPLYHRSTGCDLVNAAMILNPGGEIRLLGCQRGINTGHFYDPVPFEDRQPGVLIEAPMWACFKQAMEQGVKIVDCNKLHDESIPDVYGITRGTIL